ncbi:uncharacterized protein KY384_003777 [Bacidia gigantensis]|uniref:uncharacterized protein n=1 Tax=Bacidia gigantensis TaxID=2732470 RepID=UPI001D048C60|nr:uncharacterized protein KY384_003777 [Bacidia gigantensis]KAG8532138.1 hypothetical protein KY384_003777 [Bacidia gigantensis]
MSQDRAIERLRQLDTVSTETRVKPHAAATIKSEVDAVCKAAREHGLSSLALGNLIDLLTSQATLDQASQNVLLRSLYPAAKVGRDVVYMIVFSLGPGKQKPSNSTQSGLLRWLVLVFDLVDPSSVFSDCYNVLFNLVDVLYLRLHLCHLLTRITKRKHVKAYRIDMLRRSEEGITKDASIAKLVSIYEFLKPGSFDLSKVKLPVTFAHADPHWTEDLESIQRRNGDSFLTGRLTKDDSKYGAMRKDFYQPHGSKRLSDHFVCPETLSEVATSFERFDLSETSCSDLADRIFQRSLDLQYEAEHLGQIHEMLDVSLEGELETLDDVAEMVPKVLHPPVVNFFKSYLPIWKPAIEFEKEPLILELLSYVPILPWEEIYPPILQPMELALLDSTIETLKTLTQFYTHLMRHWNTLLRQSSNRVTLSHQIETIQKLSTHTFLLALNTLIYSTTPTQQTTSVILTYLEAHTAILSPPLSLPLPPPLPLLIYTLLFASPTLSTVSRVSAILARYKHAFEQAPSSSGPRNPEDIHSLNTVLIDTCNLLLRSRGFNITDTHAKGCLIQRPLVDALGRYAKSLTPPLDLAHCFSLSYHTGLASSSTAAFKELEKQSEVEVEHEGLVSPKSLQTLGRDGGLKIGWREYRVHVLKWLEGFGADGVGNLGRATMRGLMGGEKGRESDVAKV